MYRNNIKKILIACLITIPTGGVINDCMAQEKANLIELGIVELVSWHVNGTECQIEHIEYTSITSREDDGYTIKICFESKKGIPVRPKRKKRTASELIRLLNDNADYFNFRVAGIETEDNTTKAELTNISIENSNLVYFDDKARGTMEINHENNQVKVEIWQSTHYVIVWKNKRDDL